MKKQLGLIVALAVLMTALCVGCGNKVSHVPEKETETPPDAAVATKGGTLKLSVNPEIRLDYDENGIVTNVVAENKDGEAVLLAVEEPVGKNVTTVVDILVREIEAQGYFVNEIDDEKRMVMLQFKAGSAMPSEHFLADVTGGAQHAVEALGADNAVVTIGGQDYDRSFTSGDYITEAKAEEIALAYLSVAADKAVFEEREFDLDHGVAVYELEFTADGIEYDVDVDAVNGTVLKSKQKTDDKDVLPDAEYIAYEQAKQAALEAVGVTAEEAVFDGNGGLDREHGKVVYEVELVVDGVEYEIEVDALTAEVVNREQENDDDRHDRHDDDNDVMAEDPSFIGAEEAKRAALADAGVSEAEARFDDVELDRKKGKTVYEVEFNANGVEYDYRIDAVSGDILKAKQETDD